MFMTPISCNRDLHPVCEQIRGNNSHFQFMPPLSKGGGGATLMGENYFPQNFEILFNAGDKIEILQDRRARRAKQL